MRNHAGGFGSSKLRCTSVYTSEIYRLKCQWGCRSSERCRPPCDISASGQTRFSVVVIVSQHLYITVVRSGNIKCMESIITVFVFVFHNTCVICVSRICYVWIRNIIMITITRTTSNLRHDHPQMNTLTRWHSYANLTRILWRYMGCAKMNFLLQGFRKVSYYSLRMHAFS